MDQEELQIRQTQLNKAVDHVVRMYATPGGDTNVFLLAAVEKLTDVVGALLREVVAVDAPGAPGFPAEGDTVTTAEQLEELPTKTILTDKDGDAWQKVGKTWWSCTDHRVNEYNDFSVGNAVKYGPFTVLRLPKG